MIWPHLLKKPLMENFIFFCSDMRKGRDMFKSRKSLKKLESEGRSQTAEPKGGELPYVQQH